jgi:hypothetical protein
MSIKPVSHRIKWLAAGLVSGIFLTTFVSQMFLSDQLKNQKNDQLNKPSYKSMAYSQWPPFLTDSTFDLVN